MPLWFSFIFLNIGLLPLLVFVWLYLLQRRKIARLKDEIDALLLIMPEAYREGRRYIIRRQE